MGEAYHIQRIGILNQQEQMSLLLLINLILLFRLFIYKIYGRLDF